jgi:hypothetical protein
MGNIYIMKKGNERTMFWGLLALIIFWVIAITLLRQYIIVLVIINFILIALISKSTPLFQFENHSGKSAHEKNLKRK